jgi:rhamnogalacturonyl hydrolase YesR
MPKEPAQTFDRFVYEILAQTFWKDKEPSYEQVMKRVKEAYPHRKFTRADYYQHVHRFEHQP